MNVCEFQRTCASPEEEPPVDNYFDSGDGEAVGYENVDEPVRLDAGDVGERRWPGGRGDTDPLPGVAWPIRIPHPRSRSVVVCVCAGGRKGTVARV